MIVDGSRDAIMVTIRSKIASRSRTREEKEKEKVDVDRDNGTDDDGTDYGVELSHYSSQGDSVMISTGGGVYIITCSGELSQQHGHSQHPSSPHSA